MSLVDFNPQIPTVMHLDLNSCFATIEQQANPLLRGKPIAVAAYTTPSGCILAPSIEAKRYGIKTGMRVKDGKALYPNLIILPNDPWKYRAIHLKLKRLLSSYTDRITPKSIDEFVLNLNGFPAFQRGMTTVAGEIKQRIKKEIGEWLTISVGIAPNCFLAKTGAGLHKPDGLDEINQKNFLEIYQKLQLTDLCGIKERNTARLNQKGIFTVLDFYQASVTQLKATFNSIAGYYWYLRLHGWEIDDFPSNRQSFGNSFALPQPFTSPPELLPILHKLVEKTAQRLRRAGYQTQGVHLSFLYRDFSYWHQGRTLIKPIFASGDIYKAVNQLFLNCPYRKPVRQIAVSCFRLIKATSQQLDFFSQSAKKENLTKALDLLNNRWGDFAVGPAILLKTKKEVHDRIAFGGVKELEEFIL